MDQSPAKEIVQDEADKGVNVEELAEAPAPVPVAGDDDTATTDAEDTAVKERQKAPAAGEGPTMEAGDPCPEQPTAMEDQVGDPSKEEDAEVSDVLGPALEARAQSPTLLPHGKKRGRDSMLPGSSNPKGGNAPGFSAPVTPVAKKGKRVDKLRETRSPSRLRAIPPSLASLAPGALDEDTLADTSHVAVKGSPTSSSHSRDSSYADDEGVDLGASASASGYLVREGSPKRRRNTPPAGLVEGESLAAVEEGDSGEGIEGVKGEEKTSSGRDAKEEGNEVTSVRKKVEGMDVYEGEEGTEGDYVVVDAEEATEVQDPRRSKDGGAKDADAAAEEMRDAKADEPPPSTEATGSVAVETRGEAAKPDAVGPLEAPKPAAEATFAFKGYTPWKPPAPDAATASVFGSSASSISARAFGSATVGPSAFSSFGSRPFGSPAKDSTAGSSSFGPSFGDGPSSVTTFGEAGKENVKAGSGGGFGGFSSWATRANGFAAPKPSVFASQPEPSTAPTTAFGTTAKAGAPEGATEEAGKGTGGVEGERSFLDRLQQGDDGAAGDSESEGGKGHLAMGGVTDADRLPGFVPQHTATGEEGWTLLKSVRCKLYEFGPDKNWHESGTGSLRILRDDSLESRYRLVMRTDAVFRVILNQTLGKTFKVEQREGRYLNLIFLGSMYLAKLGQQKTFEDIYAYLERCINHIANPESVEPPEPER